MSKKREKKPNHEFSDELTGAEFAELKALVDEVVAKTLHELGLSESEPSSQPDEPEVDWLGMYLATSRFLQTGYRLQKASRNTRHHLGGSPRSSPPRRGACRTPLALFADLDATG